MKFTTAIATAILAGTALAAPERGLAARVKARAAAARGSRPLQAVQKPASVTNKTNVEYSSNWSGAVLENPPSASATYTAVTGTFTVPEPTGGSGSSSASAWVGIDGDTYSEAILQTGVDFTVTNGQASFDAWYEWLPDYAYDFTGIDISAGDVIVAIVESYSPTSGIAIIENQSTGQKVTKELSSSSPLGGINAEWIVEDYEENGSLVDLVDFGTVTFTGAEAKAAGGQTVGLTGATVIDIVQGSTVVTDVTIDSDSEVTISYV